MSKSYTRAAKPFQDTVRQVMEKFHKPLVTNNVEIGTVFVETELNEETGQAPPALTDHGMPALAKIRLASSRDRALHGCDVLLEIDALEFDPLSSGQQIALLDHELTHLRIKTNADGEYLRDGQGRVKLELRPHDWEVSGFTEVVARHKGKSVEFLNWGRVERNHRIGGQGVFDFMLDEVVKDAGQGLLSPAKKSKGASKAAAAASGGSGVKGKPAKAKSRK